MRRLAILGLLLSYAGAEEKAPVCRCFLPAKPAGLRTIEDTGVDALDKRVRSEKNFLARLFGVEPLVVILDDKAERPLFAAPGTIAFRVDWLKGRWDSDDNRAATVAFWVAHQWAHALQDKRSLKLPGISRELHADVLAGWYLGKRNFATLGSGPDLDPGFARSLFEAPDEFANERFEHGRAADRADAVATGFNLFRKDKLDLDKVFAEALKLVPPPEVGQADDVGPPEGPYRTVKVECTHKGPCRHRAPCTHPKPCEHKVACKHEAPCTHEVVCTHRVPCEHHIPCKHKVKCTHRIACVHTAPCVHRLHDCDRLHECDFDSRGIRIECAHTIPCTHFRHSCDYLHPYDYEHEFDWAHEFDRQHRYDHAHDHDLKHKFDRPHDHDFAHDWDPLHDFDPAHESDPAHVYDERYVPVKGSEGASGG